MEFPLQSMLQLLAQYPLILVAFYVFVWMLPRSMSMVLGVFTGLLIVYSLIQYSDQHWERLHYYLMWWYDSPTEEFLQVPEEYREQVEKSYTRGYYKALVTCISVVVIATPFLAYNRVEETISNIGRRPPTGKKPML